MATLELRPRSATEIIDASFQLLRANYVPLVTLSVAASLPLLVLRIFSARVASDPAMMAGNGMMSEFLIVGILAVLLQLVAENAVMVAASQSYLGGSIDAGAAIGRALRRTFPLILIAIAAGFLFVLGFIALIVPGIYIFMRLIPLQVVTVLEDVDPGEAFTRTWALGGGGRTGHVFVTWFLSRLIYFAAVVIPSMFVLVLTTVVSPMKDPNIAAIFTTALTALVLPLVIVIMVVLYYDLRIRHEGFDVEMMSKDLGTPAPRY